MLALCCCSCTTRHRLQPQGGLRPGWRESKGRHAWLNGEDSNKREYLLYNFYYNVNTEPAFDEWTDAPLAIRFVSILIAFIADRCLQTETEKQRTDRLEKQERQIQAYPRLYG